MSKLSKSLTEPRRVHGNRRLHAAIKGGKGEERKGRRRRKRKALSDRIITADSAEQPAILSQAGTSRHDTKNVRRSTWLSCRRRRRRRSCPFPVHAGSRRCSFLGRSCHCQKLSSSSRGAYGFMTASRGVRFTWVNREWARAVEIARTPYRPGPAPRYHVIERRLPLNCQGRPEPGVRLKCKNLPKNQLGTLLPTVGGHFRLQ